VSTSFSTRRLSSDSASFPSSDASFFLIYLLLLQAYSGVVFLNGLKARELETLKDIIDWACVSILRLLATVSDCAGGFMKAQRHVGFSPDMTRALTDLCGGRKISG